MFQEYKWQHNRFFLSTGLDEFLQCKSLPSFSDHNAVLLKIKFDVIGLPAPLRIIKQYNLTNINGLNKFILGEIEKLNIPFDRNMTNDAIELLASRIDQIFVSATEQFVPTIQIPIGNIILSGPTRALYSKFKTISRRKYRNRLNLHNDIRNQFNLIKNMLKNSIKNDVNIHYKNYLLDINSNLNIFEAVRRLTRHKKNTSEITRLYLDNDKTVMVSNPPQICEELANRFEQMHELTSGDISSHEDSVNESINSIDNCTDKINFCDHVRANIISFGDLKQTNDGLPEPQREILTCSEEISNIIQNRNNKKSTGHDNMPNFIIKFFDFQIIILLTTLFNQILSSHYFPKCWKTAFIIPIPKNGKDSNIISNWRPISQLNSLSKILERVIDIRLSTEAEKNDILPREQFGFRKNLSTYHPLAIMNNDITSGLNDNKMTTMVALDIQSAFDTVWHNGLLHKLFKFGTNVHLIKIIQSFLSDRTFRVKMGNNISSLKKIDRGVPQGSVVSPKLFNLYLADIPKHDRIKILQFADDIVLYFVHKRPDFCRTIFNRYLNDLFRYYSNWKLRLNSNKSELLHIVGSGSDISGHLKTKLKFLEFKIANCVIKRKTQIKYLGVIFSFNYQFNRHIDNIVRKANIAFHNLRHLICSRFISSKYKRALYVQYIRPIIQYGAPIWLNNTTTSSHQIERLRKLERKIIRHTSCTYRSRNNFKYINNAELYKNAEISRIDAQLLKITLNFLENCRNSINHFIRGIVEPFRDKKYFNSSHLLHKSDNGLLHDETGQLREFHVGKYNRNRMVYNLNQ